MTGVLIRRGEGTQSQTHAEGRQCEDTQGEPRVTTEAEAGTKSRGTPAIVHNARS